LPGDSPATANLAKGARQRDGSDGPIHGPQDQRRRTPTPQGGHPRTMLPSTWVSRSVRLEYVGAGGQLQETSATLLDWCGMGSIFNIGGARTVVGWDRLAVVELVEGGGG
jgi:hypothetical protein